MIAIMYHYVREHDDDLPHFRHLHTEDFGRQLDWLCREWKPVTKSASVQHLMAARFRRVSSSPSTTVCGITL